jgi:hypothetical protein
MTRLRGRSRRALLWRGSPVRHDDREVPPDPPWDPGRAGSDGGVAAVDGASARPRGGMRWKAIREPTLDARIPTESLGTRADTCGMRTESGFGDKQLPQTKRLGLRARTPSIHRDRISSLAVTIRRSA